MGTGLPTLPRPLLLQLSTAFAVGPGAGAGQRGRQRAGWSLTLEASTCPAGSITGSRPGGSDWSGQSAPWPGAVLAWPPRMKSVGTALPAFGGGLPAVPRPACLPWRAEPAAPGLSTSACGRDLEVRLRVWRLSGPSLVLELASLGDHCPLATHCLSLLSRLLHSVPRENLPPSPTLTAAITPQLSGALITGCI